MVQTTSCQCDQVLALLRARLETARAELDDAQGRHRAFGVSASGALVERRQGRVDALQDAVRDVGEMLVARIA